MQRDAAQGGQIVIADQARQLRQLADARDALVGIRPVADQVAQAPDGVEGSRVLQDPVERRQVGMDVGDDQDTHRQDGNTDAARGKAA